MRLRRPGHGALVAALLVGSTAGCGESAPTATPSPAPVTFRTAQFTLVVPAGWHTRTIDDRGAQGILYGVSSDATGVPEGGIAPAGVTGVQVAVIPVSSVPPIAGDVAGMTPTQLLQTGAGFPAGATNQSTGAATGLTLAGQAAAIETQTFVFQGSAQRREAVAARRDGTLFLISVTAPTDQYPAADRAFQRLLLSWAWTH